MQYEYKHEKEERYKLIIKCNSAEQASEIFEGVIPENKRHLFKLQKPI